MPSIPASALGPGEPGSARERYDVVVVGGGPAGAAAALRIRQLSPDTSVAILDRDDFPRDKTCGDGVSAHSVGELATLGVLDVLHGHEPIPNVHLRGASGISVAAPPPQACYVVPRRVLDGRLIAAAAERGAVVRRHRVRALAVRRSGRGEPTVIIDDRFEAGTVIGADGANSVVRKLIGVPASSPAHTAIAVRGYTERTPAGPDELFITMEEPSSLSYAWAFPLPGGGANVGYGRSVTQSRQDGQSNVAAMERRMRALLPGLGEVRDLRAHRLPLSTEVVRQPAGRVLLAGDALSLVNPITGEGIHHALRSGRMAGEAAIAGHRDPGLAYRRELSQVLGAHLRQTRAMARVCLWPGFIDSSVRLAQRRTDVWHAICDLGLGVGTAPASVVARLLSAYAVARAGGVHTTRKG